MIDLNKALLSSASNDWYTPAWVASACRDVFLTPIDLDPASCKEANEKYIKARRYYSLTERGEDGLKMQWFGNVFCNPPYGKTDGKSNQWLWYERMYLKTASGTIDSGILLLKAAVGYKWFECVMKLSNKKCFTYELLSFKRPASHPQAGREKSAKLGTCFVYFGNDPDRFESVFSEFGKVFK